MSNGDSDGGETTLGSPRSPPESLSPCFWAGGGAQSGSVAGQPRAEAQMPDCGRLSRLSDVCASMESAASLSPLVTRSSGVAAAATTGAAGEPTARKTLLLSPASQLDVLSQISEMAERVGLCEAGPAPAQTGPAPSAVGRPHAWSTARRRRKKRAAPVTEAGDEGVEHGGSLVALLVPGSKKRRTATHAPQHSDKLETDMLDWETCSEDLFLGLDDAPDDPWEFEDVSDSDFE